MTRLLSLAALLVASPLVHGQPQSSADVVTWTAQLTRSSGASVLVLDAVIAEGWRVYAPGSPVGRPLRLRFDVGDVVESVSTSRPSAGRDASTGQRYLYFSDRLRIEATLAGGMAARETASRAEVAYMACNDRLCLRPSRSRIALRALSR